jgi:hypothetical protein
VLAGFRSSLADRRASGGAPEVALASGAAAAEVGAMIVASRPARDRAAGRFFVSSLYTVAFCLGGAGVRRDHRLARFGTGWPGRGSR